MTTKSSHRITTTTAYFLRCSCGWKEEAETREGAAAARAQHLAECKERAL